MLVGWVKVMNVGQLQVRCVIIVGEVGLITLHYQLQWVKNCCVDETSEHFSFRVLVNAPILKEVSNMFTFHTVEVVPCTLLQMLLNFTFKD